jgi:hypothetical protein
MWYCPVTLVLMHLFPKKDVLSYVTSKMLLMHGTGQQYRPYMVLLNMNVKDKLWYSRRASS